MSGRLTQHWQQQSKIATQFFELRKIHRHQQSNTDSNSLRFEPEYRKHGSVFTGEEILLAGLYRAHTIGRLGDSGWRALWTATSSLERLLLFISF